MRFFKRAAGLLAAAVAGAVGLTSVPVPLAVGSGSHVALERQTGSSTTETTTGTAAVAPSVRAPRVVRLLDRRAPGRSRQAWVIRKPRRGAAFAAVLT